MGNYRYGFATPPNYNDHELYCGGFTRQWRDNSGKCGICGDPWNTKQVICKITRKHKINFAIRISYSATYTINISSYITFARSFLILQFC